MSDNIPSLNTSAQPEGENSASPFDVIRHTDEQGQEYWSARELAKVLGYIKWDKFKNVLSKAETACKNAGYEVAAHFLHTGNMAQIGLGKQRRLEDVRLSRYGCYLAADNADPSKRIVAQAQTYFVTSTRRDELRRQQDMDELRAAQQQRLKIRVRVSEKNKDLAAAAQDAGVTRDGFPVFQDAGYKGLYNGLGVEEIKEKKAIPPKGDILDHMDSEELGANIFRITQTEAKLRREAIQGEQAATNTHHEVGRIVRGAIKEAGGTMPEESAPRKRIAVSLAKLDRIGGKF